MRVFDNGMGEKKAITLTENWLTQGRLVQSRFFNSYASKRALNSNKKCGCIHSRSGVTHHSAQ
jgi:hypothetical protein